MDKNLEEFLTTVDISDVAKAKIRSLYKLKKKLNTAKIRVNISFGIFLCYFLLTVMLLAFEYRGDMYAMYKGVVDQWFYLGLLGVLGGTYYMAFPMRFKKKKDEADDDYHELRKEIVEEINGHYNVWMNNQPNMLHLYNLIAYLDENYDINIKYKSKK
jgi:hypothetical protein